MIDAKNKIALSRLFTETTKVVWNGTASLGPMFVEFIMAQLPLSGKQLKRERERDGI